MSSSSSRLAQQLTAGVHALEGSLRLAQRALQKHGRPASGEIPDLRAQLAEISQLVCTIATDADAGFLADHLAAVGAGVERVTMQSLLSGPADHLGARLQITAGSGGTEAMDFACKLMGAYSGYAASLTRRPAALLALAPGPEAGIRSVDLIVHHPFAYGLLRSEHGAHRFRRVSPFGKDAGKKRQTSFAQIAVYPIDDGAQSRSGELNMDDVKVETMRAMGPGGQGVNTTSSAVRLTHVPTGLTAQCQDERSQLRNKQSALSILRGRLLERKLREAQSKQTLVKASLGEASFGSQVRTWQYGPPLVVDHRTAHSTVDIDGVFKAQTPQLLNGFSRAFLAWEVA
jgi:peptide chain release factor 2